MKDIPLIINNKYNYRFLQKINLIYDFNNYVIKPTYCKKNINYNNNIHNFILQNSYSISNDTNFTLNKIDLKTNNNNINKINSKFNTI